MTEAKLDFSRYFWQSENVRLRPFCLEDAEVRFMASLDSPTRQAHNDGIELPTSVELQREWLEKVAGCQDNGRIVLFVIENLAGEMAGWISLHSRNQKNGTFSFGVAVYRAYRGQGYAVEAARMLLKYGFWEQRYQKCNSICTHTNAASMRMHAKLGFVEEGRGRRNNFFNGQYHDDVYWGMTREEFDALMPA
ncbi:MAG: GNAT family N-acetyltransferase [Anaerolineae bacterium]|nr:GNAT family N-acetyltransferase [Anaerolineae bacterium]